MRSHMKHTIQHNTAPQRSRATKTEINKKKEHTSINVSGKKRVIDLPSTISNTRASSPFSPPQPVFEHLSAKNIEVN